MDAYIYQADLYCEDCIIQIKGSLRDRELEPPNPENEHSFDSDDYPKGPYPNGGGEADSPQHCGSCGLFLENPLTMEGELYVENAVESCIYDRQGDPEIVNKWAVFYDDLQLPHCK